MIILLAHPLRIFLLTFSSSYARFGWQFTVGWAGLQKQQTGKTVAIPKYYSFSRLRPRVMCNVMAN